MDLERFFEIYGALGEDEVTALVLLARKKYYPELKKSERVVAARVLYGPMSAEDMARIARSFVRGHTECPAFKSGGDKIPLRALSFSAIASPRSKRAVAKNFTRRIVDNALGGNFDVLMRPETVLLSEIMKGSGKRHYVFDVDEPGEKGLEIVRWLIEELPCEHIVVQTHGGYHVLMKRGACLRNLAKLKFPETVEYGHIPLAALPETPRGGVMTRIVNV